MLRPSFLRLLPVIPLCSSILLATCNDSSIEVGPFGTVAGAVGISQGGGLANVGIQLARAGIPTRTTHTDFQGVYRFERVEPGTWDLVYLVPEGYLPASAPANPITINVAAGAITNVAPLIFYEATPAATKLVAMSAVETFGETGSASLYQVQAQDAGGRPVANVPVEWSLMLGGGSLRTSTSPDGLFHFAEHTLGPGEGANTVTATAPTIAGRPKITFITTGVSKRVWVVGGPTFYYGILAPAFDPADVTIAAGQTVGWEWWSTLAHQLVFEDAPEQQPGSPVQIGGTHFRKFDSRGTFRYRCTLHSTSFTSGMVGVVKVQ